MGTGKRRQRKPEKPGNTSPPRDQDQEPTAQHGSGTERALRALAASAMPRPKKDAADTQARWELGRRNLREIRSAPSSAARMSIVMNWRDGYWRPADALVHRHAVGKDQWPLGVSERYAKSLGRGIQRPQKKGKKVQLTLHHKGSASKMTCMGSIPLATKRVDQGPAADKPVEVPVLVWKGENMDFDMIIDPAVARQYIREEPSPKANRQPNSTSNVAPGSTICHMPATPFSPFSPGQDNVSQGYAVSTPGPGAVSRTTPSMSHRPVERNVSHGQFFNSVMTPEQPVASPGISPRTTQSNPAWQVEFDASIDQPYNYDQNLTSHGHNADYGQSPGSAIPHGQDLMLNGYYPDNDQRTVSTSVTGHNPVDDFDDRQSQTARFPMLSPPESEPEPVTDIDLRAAFQHAISGNFHDLDTAPPYIPIVHAQAIRLGDHLPVNGIADNARYHGASNPGARPLRSLDCFNSEAWASAGLLPPTTTLVTGTEPAETGKQPSAEDFSDPWSRRPGPGV
ncbi:hypothetical protein QQX98_007219 [Neonectria punicea]|uniref:Uncharacterized protein n=1 Tax=Neonectria punicea TaxID=979145 RepID=A0ABR1GYH5_9HYPO